MSLLWAVAVRGRCDWLQRSHHFPVPAARSQRHLCTPDLLWSPCRCCRRNVRSEIEEQALDCRGNQASTLCLMKLHHPACAKA